MMSTVWFVVLVGVCSFVAGAALRPWLCKATGMCGLCKKG